LRDGSARGVFRKNLDPIHLYMSFSALAYNYVSNLHTLNVVLGIDLTTDKRQAAWLAFITDLIISYCRAGISSGGPTRPPKQTRILGTSGHHSRKLRK
jgi:hypothetical protein